MVSLLLSMYLPYCTYVLFCHHDKKLYIGFSSNLKNRLNDHKNGKVISTKGRRPLELIYTEFHSNKFDALRREKYFKTTSGKKGLKLMLREKLAMLKKSDFRQVAPPSSGSALIKIMKE